MPVSGTLSSHDSVLSSELKHSFAPALFVDLRRRAGALENGHFGHSAHRYTRRIAFLGGGAAMQVCIVPGTRGTTGAQMVNPRF